MIEKDINKIIIFYRSSKASIKTEDLAKAIVFNATKKTITEGKTETIEHADILDISREATEIPKVSLNFILCRSVSAFLKLGESSSNAALSILPKSRHQKDISKLTDF